MTYFFTPLTKNVITFLTYMRTQTIHTFYVLFRFAFCCDMSNFSAFVAYPRISEEYLGCVIYFRDVYYFWDYCIFRWRRIFLFFLLDLSSFLYFLYFTQVINVLTHQSQLVPNPLGRYIIVIVIDANLEINTYMTIIILCILI